MKDNDTIHLRIAEVLRSVEYSALSLILLALGLRLLDIDCAFLAANTGIGLIVFAPVTGILAVAVISFINKNYRYMMLSLSILLIFTIAVAVSIW